MKTFNEARDCLIAKLDQKFLVLRHVVSDPLWCNTAYAKYVDAKKKIDETLDLIARLNSVASEVNPR